MEYIKINHEELSALCGLPYLQQLIYLIGIKPHIDYRTGIVGLKRGISYQSLAEALYVEPHSGIKSGSPSKDQIRRAIKGLEKAGVLSIQSLERKLVFHCLLVAKDLSSLNKPAIKSHDQIARVKYHDNPLKQRGSEDLQSKPTPVESNEAAIPQDNYYYIFLLGEFEKFWERYPLKKSKQKTWEQFQALQPTEALLAQIFASLEQQILASNQQQAQGLWTPGWKFPANWLAQHCWKDEIQTSTTEEKTHAVHQQHHPVTRAIDPFWDSCKAGASFVARRSNIVEIGGHRKSSKSH